MIGNGPTTPSLHRNSRACDAKKFRDSAQICQVPSTVA
jgi:hypothetical protein